MFFLHQFFDVGRKGFCDLSSMFGQKASLYQDPNMSQTYGGGFDGTSGDDANFYQGQNRNDQPSNSYQGNSYQNDFFDEFESKNNRPLAKSASSNSVSKMSGKPKENTLLLTSSASSSGPNPSAAASGLSKEEQLLGQIAARPVQKKKNSKSAEDDVWNMLNETGPKKSSSKRK